MAKSKARKRLRLKCPRCERRFANKLGIAVHMGHMHLK